MNTWTDLILERVETAYRARFEKEAALIYLNDAYQSALFLRMRFNIEDDAALAAFMKQFMAVRDLFISLVVDRYPSNYNEVEQKITTLRTLHAALSDTSAVRGQEQLRTIA